MTIHKKMALLFFYLPIQATYCSSSPRSKSENSTLPSSVKKPKKYVLKKDEQETGNLKNTVKKLKNSFEDCPDLQVSASIYSQGEASNAQIIKTKNTVCNPMSLQQKKSIHSMEHWIELKVKNCMLLQVDKEDSTMKGRVIPTPCGNIKVNFVCMAISFLYRKYFENSFN